MPFVFCCANILTFAVNGTKAYALPIVIFLFRCICMGKVLLSCSGESRCLSNETSVRLSKIFSPYGKETNFRVPGALRTGDRLLSLPGLRKMLTILGAQCALMGKVLMSGTRCLRRRQKNQSTPLGRLTTVS